MREILFRGKRFDNEKWIEGNYIAVRNSHFSYIQRIDKPTDCYRVAPETVGQYTNSTDKNGKKIFEGDVMTNGQNDFGIIQWFEEHAAFMLWCTNQNKVYYLWDNDLSKIEVIGNIFDNPELLKGD